MKDKNTLAEAQKEIYNFVTTKDWFTPDDIPPRFRNIDSQCRKIADKGYFEFQAIFDPEYPGDLSRLKAQFKKVLWTGKNE